MLQKLPDIKLFDGGIQSTAKFADAISGLDLVQQKAALSAKGLKVKQSESVISMLDAALAAETLSLEDAALAANMKEAKLAGALGIEVRDKLTASTLLAAVADGKLTQAQFDSITATAAQTAATNAQSVANNTLAASAKAAFAAMLTNPLTWISLLPLAITGVTKLHDLLTFTAKEAHEAADELTSAFEETEHELEDVNSELETARGRLEELEQRSISGELSIVDNQDLIDLREEVELLERRARLLQEQEGADAEDTYREQMNAYDMDRFSTQHAPLEFIAPEAYSYFKDHKDQIQVYQDMMSGVSEAWDRLSYEEKNAAQEAGETFNSILNAHKSWAARSDLTWNEHFDNVLTNFKRLDAIDPLELDDDAALERFQASFKESREAMVDMYSQLQDIRDKAVTDGLPDGLRDDDLDQMLEMLDAALYKSEHWSESIGKLDDELRSVLDKAGESGKLTAISVDELAQWYPKLAAWMWDCGYTAEDVAERLNTLGTTQNVIRENAEDAGHSIVSLAESMAELKSSYELLESAQNDMSSGGGLSTDTIEKLAKAEENYLDYLYEENGVIKLNTAEWKKNADAKMRHDTAEIREARQEIDSLNTRNDALREELMLLEDQRVLGNDKGEYAKRIAEIIKELSKNSAAIEDNQGLLRLYSAIYQQISGDGTAAFRPLTDALTTITEQYELLNKAQEEFSESGALSASTLSSIASQFPEMQQSVDLYITGLKSEKELLNDLADAYDADLANYRSAVFGKLMASTEFYNSLSDDQKKLVDDFSEAYGVDLKNFKDVERAKLEFQAKVIRALSKNYKQYRLAGSDELNDRLRYLINNGGDQKEIKAVSDALTLIDGYDSTIDEIISKDPDLSSWDPKRFYTTGSSSGSKDDKKEVEEYIVAIDDYREAIERLDRVQRERDDLELKLSNETDLDRQIELQKELLGLYEDEQHALHTLNELRRETIAENVAELRDKYGFEVEYDPKNNQFFIKNLEHINELKGKDQEATNELRKEIEELVDQTIDLNDANEKNSQSWREIEYNKRKARVAIHEDTIKGHENAITLAEDHLDNAVADKNVKDAERHSNEIVAHYRAKQEELHELAEYYRSQGYSDTSDEVSSLSDAWWDCEASIRAAKQRVVDSLTDIVSATGEALDQIQNVYDTLKGAADEFEQNGGFISIDTYQSILDLGPQYMQMLEDENGLLVINEERIKEITAAKVEQLALDNAMAYVERLRLAMQEDSIEDLDELLYATTKATDATWGMVYANLAMLGLDKEQHEAALHTIDAIRALADTAADSIGKTAGAAANGFDSILDYVMDMLKQSVQDQIDALNDMKDAYGEIIDQRKQALDLAKKESSYQDQVSGKVKEIAKLQARIDALALDDSREAQAERGKLEEEMAEKQKELSDIQSDYAIENQKNALDEMKQAYDDEKDGEIEDLKESISSQQKIYEKAIDYIRSYWEGNWDELKVQLLQWNFEVGNSLQSEIESAWDNCSQYIRANPLNFDKLFPSKWEPDGDGGSGAQGSSEAKKQSMAVGNTLSDDDKEHVSRNLSEMQKNSLEWHDASTERKKELEDRNADLAAELEDLLHVEIERIGGTWYVKKGGQRKKLYDEYADQVEKFHTGGVAGNEPTLKQNEVMAILKDGEAVLDEGRQQNLYRLIDFATVLSDRMEKLFDATDAGSLLSGMRRDFVPVGAEKPGSITNNKQLQVEFGDTYIYGANQQTVEEHQAITRRQTNELLELLQIKR